VINQAIGKPATKSISETKRAIAKDEEIAVAALDIKLGFSKICPIVFHLRSIPRIGGIKINPKKETTAHE